MSEQGQDGAMGGSQSNLGFDDLGFDESSSETSFDSSQGAPTIDDFNEMDNARQDTFDAKQDELDKLQGKSSEGTQEEEGEEEGKEEAKASDKKDEADTEESEEEEIEAKYFKGKVGDKDLDINEDSMIPVKINGQTEMISARDLVNNYSGKTNYDRMYSEFDVEKKEHQTAIDEAKYIKSQNEDFLSNFANDMKEGGSLEALKKNLDHFGVDKYTFMKGLRDQYAPEIENYLYMSEEERRAYDLSEENAYLKEKTQIADDQLSNAQSERDVNQQITKVTEQYGFTRDEFKDAFLEIKEAGNIKEDDVTVDLLTNYISDNKAVDSAITLLKSIDENITSSEGASKAVKVVAEWYKEVQNGEMTEEQVKELVYDVLEVDEKTAKELSDKLGNSDSVQSKKFKKPIKDNTYVDFDHLD